MSDVLPNQEASSTRTALGRTGSLVPGHEPGLVHWVDRGTASRSDRGQFHVLVLAEHFLLPYRVMRCFAEAGAAVHILGGPGAYGLRFSRFCRSYHASRFDLAIPSEALSEEINAYITERGIDLVLAGDHELTRTLILLEASLSAGCFPMPTLEQFDLLNNKWTFTQLCQQLALRCPRSELLTDRTELARRVHSGEITMPCIVKPLDSSGSHGLLPIKRREDGTATATIEYHPILVQEFIEGGDIGASVYCDGGVVRAFIAHRMERGKYSTFESDEIRAAITSIVSTTKVTGVLNFDMRIGLDKKIYWLECNPRFFAKSVLSMLAGINFASFGLPHAAPKLCASVPAGTNVRTFKAIASELPPPWRLTSLDWAFVRHVLADPIPCIRQSLRIDR